MSLSPSPHLNSSRYRIDGRMLPAVPTPQPIRYEISDDSTAIAHIDLASHDFTTDTVVLRGLRLAADRRVDDVVNSLRALCDTIWLDDQVQRIQFTCAAGDGPARQAMSTLGAVLEGVQRTIPVPGDAEFEDQAQFSILRREWQRSEGVDAGEGSAESGGPIIVRSARTHDLQGLYDVERSAFGVGYDLGHLRQFIDVFQGLVLIADQKGGPAAGYLLPAPTHLDPRTAWILSMGVRREKQAQGIGQALLDAGLSLLSSLGVREVFLSVDPHNERAMHLYHRNGFLPHGHVDDYFGPHEDRLTMSLALPASEHKHATGRNPL